MIIFIRKIKTKEGINSIDLDKVRNDIPSGFVASDNEPQISLTANHVVVAFICKPYSKPAADTKTKTKTKAKAKPKAKKVMVGKV